MKFPTLIKFDPKDGRFGVHPVILWSSDSLGAIGIFCAVNSITIPSFMWFFIVFLMVRIVNKLWNIDLVQGGFVGFLFREK